MGCSRLNNYNTIHGCGCHTDLGKLSQYVTVVLPIHLVKNKNVLIQSMMDKEGVKYVIKWDYVLGEDITVPENCLIEFDGGSISNDDENTYTLTGQSTAIIAPPTKIFGLNVELAGTWNVSEAYPEWFGAKGDGETIDTLPIQKVMDYFNTILFSKVYISKPIIFRSNRVVNFAPESKIYATEDYQDYEDLNDPSHPPKGWSPDCIFELTKVSNVTINGNGAELSMLDYFQYDKGTDANKYAYSQSRHCVRINCSQNVSIYNLNCNQSGGDGFCLGWGSEGLDTTNNTYQHNENILLYGCGADHNKRQGISVIDGINVLIEGCSLKRSFRMPGAGIDMESNFSSQEYYALRNINISNCYTEDNIEGIRITPQHYSDAVSISVFNHTSYNDQAGLAFNRVGNGGAGHPRAKGSIIVVGYSILCPKHCAINLYNMFASDITLDIHKVFIKNVGSDGQTEHNRLRSAIMLIDESSPKNPQTGEDWWEENPYSGNYTISDVTIDDDREVSNCFAYIYGEIRYYTVAPLKNITISNIKGNGYCINREAVVIRVDNGNPRTLTRLSEFLDPSVYFNVSSYDGEEPTSSRLVLAGDAGYAPIKLNRNNVDLTRSLFIEQPFKFINYSGLGNVYFQDGAHCLRYNNDIITRISCKPDAEGAEITIKYNGDYWEVDSIKGDWDFMSHRVGVSDARPRGIGQPMLPGEYIIRSILNPAYDEGFEYYDTVLHKPIYVSGLNLSKVLLYSSTPTDTNAISIDNTFFSYTKFNIRIEHTENSTVEVYVSKVENSYNVENGDAILIFSSTDDTGASGVDITTGVPSSTNENGNSSLLYKYIVFRTTVGNSANIAISKYQASFNWVDALGNTPNTIYDAVAGSNTDNPVEDEEPTD